jgi:hypothetical protein
VAGNATFSVPEAPPPADVAAVADPLAVSVVSLLPHALAPSATVAIAASAASRLVGRPTACMRLTHPCRRIALPLRRLIL